MNSSEIIEMLEKLLSIEIVHERMYEGELITVKLKLDGKTISEDSINPNIFQEGYE